MRATRHSILLQNYLLPAISVLIIALKLPFFYLSIVFFFTNYLLIITTIDYCFRKLDYGRVENIQKNACTLYL
jgi:hypothetical protein